MILLPCWIRTPTTPFISRLDIRGLLPSFVDPKKEQRHIIPKARDTRRKASTVTYYLPASIALRTFSATSSISRALRGGKGRFMARSSTTGLPCTRTTKLPRPGFSAFTATGTRPPTACTILLARVLKAPHCLQASMETTTEPWGAAAAGAIFFLAATAFFLAGAALAGDAAD